MENICSKCKIERRLKSGYCKACRNEYFKEYRKRNREKILAAKAKYRKENKDKIKLYRQNNRETLNKKNLERYHSTPTYKLLNRYRAANYHAMKKNKLPKWTNLEKMKEIYLNCPPNHTVRHIIPLDGEYLTGLHVPSNLQYVMKGKND